jgi:hypothetical protein
MWAPRHPFFRHAKAAAWLATRAGKPIGRISGQVDALQAECGRPTMGQFGQLEAIDDPAVFQTAALPIARGIQWCQYFLGEARGFVDDGGHQFVIKGRTGRQLIQPVTTDQVLQPKTYVINRNSIGRHGFTSVPCAVRRRDESSRR